MLTFALDKTHLFPILPHCGVNIVQHQWTFSLRISANDLWFIETSDTIPNKWMCRRAFANRQAPGEEPYKKLRHSVSKPKTAHWLYTATRWLSGQPVVIGCCDIVVALPLSLRSRFTAPLSLIAGNLYNVQKIATLSRVRRLGVVLCVTITCRHHHCGGEHWAHPCRKKR